MRFIVTGYGPDDAYIGGATNHRSDPARRFCDAYRSIAANLLDAQTLRLEPAFWGGQVSDPTMEPLRYCYYEEEEPGIFAAVFSCLGYEPSTFDVVVMMPEAMALQPITRDSLLPLVIQDAASILADEASPDCDLSWTSGDLKRAAIAAILTRAAEPMFSSAAAIDMGYDQVCVSALNGLLRQGYTGLNGPALLVRRNPGLASLIDSVVRSARELPAMKLRVDADTALESGERTIEAATRSLGRSLQIAPLD